MSDLISRQAAIDALNDEYHGMISDESMKIYQIINWLNDLPSAQPQREKGKWIDNGYMNEWWGEEYTCSNCGGTMIGITDYCSDCGAEMKET